jgi:putative nucleotidyltransferase with HDIG domain
MWIVACGLPSLLLMTGWTRSLVNEVAALSGALALLLLLNTTMMAVAVRLLRRIGILRALRSALAGNVLTFLAMPLLGILIAHLMDAPPIDRLVVFLLYGPVLIYRTSLQKQRRLDTWLHDSFIMQSRVVDKRDGQTFGHSQRVGELCEQVARLLHLNDIQCNTIRVGGILHDLGKIAIPDSILLKPGKLTPEEYEIIKTHPVEGAQILAEHPEQKGVAEIVHHHHERWDGKGYPDGLKGGEIPIGSRIVNACDAFDTITQARVFRPTVRTPAEAIRELRDLAGTWYDPAVIEALEKIVAERWGVELAPRQAAVRPTGYREALAIRPFRLLWLGQSISFFGDTMNVAGLLLLLYFLTRSASMVALGLIARAIPTVIFGLLAGPLVDRFNRQRLMIAADLARAALTVTIPYFAFHWLPGVYLAVFLVATASAFFNPAKQAIIPNLVPANLLVRANGVVSSSENLMQLIGYSVAGVIAASVSFIPLFIADAATYLISALTLLGVPDLASRAGARAVQIRSDIAAGARFVARSPVLRTIMTQTLVTAFLLSMTTTVLVPLALGPLHGGRQGYGFLEAAIGAGAMLGALAAAELMTRFKPGRLILFGMAGVGFCASLTGLVGSLWPAVVLLLLGGVLNTIYYLPIISLAQRWSPDHVRGRVMSTRFLLVQVGVLAGMGIGGPLSDRVGPQLVFLAAGITLVFGGLVGFVFREMREASLEDEVSPEAVPAVTG